MERPLSALLTIGPLVLAALVARLFAPGPFIERMSSWLRSRWAPVVAGVLTAALVTWLLGGLRPAPRLHDGAAYLLQARIFASLHWVAPSPPLPEFFEQFHVFVTPVLASKYPPGQSLVMVPGIWLGVPALMPVLLSGVTGLLAFVIARRLASEWTALLAWLLWTSSRGVIRFLPSYLSQTTTCALWLLGWWLLLRWRDSGRRRWLVLFGFCVGWGLITHPYTWLLYAVPAVWVVLRLAWQRRSSGDVAAALAAGTACLVLLGVYNAKVTGKPLQMTWSAYARQYFPDDRLGFGAVAAKPERDLPADMQQWDDSLHAFHARYTPRRLPTELARRLLVLGGDVWGPNRQLLAPFALAGLLAVSPELAFALLTCAIVVAGYLLFGFDARWSAYYVELLPVFAYLTAAGLARVLMLLSRHGSSSPIPWRSAVSAPALASLVFAVTFLPNIGIAGDWGNQFQALHRDELRRFHQWTSRSLGSRSVIFVRYGPAHDVNKSLIMNDPDLAHAPRWIVRDRGADDLRLIRRAPGRAPYLYDGASDTLTPLDTTNLALITAPTAVR